MRDGRNHSPRDGLQIGVHARDVEDGSGRHADALESYVARKPLPWRSFHVRKAGLLADLGEPPQDTQCLATLEALRERAKTAGLVAELPLIDAALGAEEPVARKTA